MKLLKCILCSGEIEIIGNEKGVCKKVQCLNCGFNNEHDFKTKQPEIIFLKKRLV
jgi:hypothetical protein